MSEQFDQWRQDWTAHHLARRLADEAEARDHLRRALQRSVALDRDGKLPSWQESQEAAIRDQEEHENHEIELRRSGSEIRQDIEAARDTWEPRETDPEAAVSQHQFEERIGAHEERIGAHEERIGAHEERIGAHEERIEVVATQVGEIEKGLEWVRRWLWVGWGVVQAIAIRLSTTHPASRLGRAIAMLERECPGPTESNKAFYTRLGLSRTLFYRSRKVLRQGSRQL